MVMGPNYEGEIGALPGLVLVPTLSGAELVGALERARFALIGGGDMLSQAVSLRIPTIACPVAKDQGPRIAAFARHGYCVSAVPTELAEAALTAMSGGAFERTRAHLEALGLRNGLEVALEQIAEIVDDPR